MTVTAIEATGLGKRYETRGRRRESCWALSDCSFRLPVGRVCALVGPNGAGKSTLLALAAGLLPPTEGSLRILGTDQGSARARLAYVAQDKPLYPQLTVGETLRMGSELNPGSWDAETAEQIVEDGMLDHGCRIRTLSGGQRTRIALALALGKRPELLLLDEPMADLDPLARQQLMGIVLAGAAEHNTTVVISSHVLTELEDACDFLLLVDGGQVRLGGEIDDLIDAHRLVTGPVRDLSPHTVVESRATGRGLTSLIRPEGPLDDGWQTDAPSLEELLLAHLRSPDAPIMLTPSARSLTAVAA
ncbi:ABC transporter ATP-binding protein [Streptomyces sp. NPDC088116]|uniref:ABC transporter ATP-binding protein n=1 Tax=Streptomyces sp. NPDC088116 TaxID=3365825 RepID=UPI00380D4895